MQTWQSAYTALQLTSELWLSLSKSQLTVYGSQHMIDYPGVGSQRIKSDGITISIKIHILMTAYYINMLTVKGPVTYNLKKNI